MPVTPSPRGPAAFSLRSARTVLATGLLAALWLQLPVPPASAATPPDSDAPIIVKTGMYIVDLSNLDLAGNTFSIAMWQWFVHNSPDYMPYKTLEIVNAAAFATELDLKK